ncbi:cytochrome c [uncultured Imperialibacter sp.]|uniref:c-type cytochrome n=1 Tax=uncultured Imperialibacter sp. TaxID=1672639 RepID=UPI0030D7CB56|tara:strand:- start:16514 stop:17002 length:489 start_codon:yes stop_codon:yes gene_type:complete
MSRKRILALALVSFMAASISMTSCSSGDKKQEAKSDDIYDGLDERTSIRLRQYMSEGAQLYKQNCSACHQTEGQGLAALIPPLAGSDFLMADAKKAACIIKNGQSGKITVNGVEYDGVMPMLNLKDLEIAEILTYISNSWGNKKGLIDVNDVAAFLKDCETK